MIWPNLRYTLTPIVAAASTVALAVTVTGLAVSARIMDLGRVVDSLGRSGKESR